MGSVAEGEKGRVFFPSFFPSFFLRTPLDCNGANGSNSVAIYRRIFLLGGAFCPIWELVVGLTAAYRRATIP